MKKSFFLLLTSLFTLLTSCIEPPLKLPAEELIFDAQINVSDIDVVWNVDLDWKQRWYYGWDQLDSALWGPIAYPMPTNYEVRRYYLGEQPGGKHSSVEGFTVFGSRFRRSYIFGYYDMLLWSNIDSPDGTQVVVIDESSLDEVKATTTVSRGLSRTRTDGSEGVHSVTGLYNQPEIFYSTYARDLHISRDVKDYDYYDEEERCWVKRIDCELTPLVYIYLVQFIILNNDGRVVGTTGNAALSGFSSGTNVNNGHTDNSPVAVYFGTRYKDHLAYETQTADIIGGKLTTYGLCDMDASTKTRGYSYNGSRTDLHNYLMLDVSYRNGATQTLQFDVTDQCRSQAHGGIITVVVDAGDLDIPISPSGDNSGSLFVPTVEDYDEVVYEIPIFYDHPNGN